MNEETDLLFHVVYMEQECSLQLSKHKTVGDLKLAIFKKLGVAPYKQSIECWHKYPSSDHSSLITCCLSNECNFLVVYNVEDNFQNIYASDAPSHGITTEQTEPTNRSDELKNEISSVLSFIQYFSINYSSRGITFSTCCLDDAFNQALNQKQIVLLYLHNEKEPFAKTFCEQLTKANIQNIINTKYFLLCWDIEKEDFRTTLIRTLHRHAELRIYKHLIDFKTCSALLIAPKRNSIVVTNVIRGNVTPEDILSTLQQAKSSSADNQKHTFGSKEYQQLMLDMLGDRDYDSFDVYEHIHLKNNIGFALYGPPSTVDGYKEKENEKIEFLFNIILKQNNLVAKWKDRVIVSFIYVCMEPLPREKENRAKQYKDYDPNSDLTPVPIFVLRKCKRSVNPCRIFIDDIGRVYNSWENYLSNNKLPECEMVFPENGRYQADENGNVITGRALSPACDISSTILQGADIASAIGGIASGGTMIAAASIPAVAAAPFVVPIAGLAGVAVGAYALGRSAFELHDRSKHRQSLSFFESAEARGAYINIVAGSLGFVGAGANLMVSRLAAQGFNIGTGATAAVNTLNVINLGAGGAGIVNGSYDIIRKWMRDNEAPSMLTIIQLSSSILFFGHAVYNYRSINTVIEESQANILRDYQDSLRSNRHRKAFTKLLKETIRQSDGNLLRGQAEVISTIKNIQNRDEVFATLTRANKNMNRNNVRFAASNGEITFNGVSIDMAQFRSMEKTEVITFLTRLPEIPNATSPAVRNMTTCIRNSFHGINPSEILNLAIGLVKLFGSTDSTIKEKIINAVSELIKALIKDRYMDILERIFPNHTKYFQLFTMVNTFFQRKINEVEERYAVWLETQDPEKEEPYFMGLMSLTTAQRIAKIFNIISDVYYKGTHVTETGLKELLNYFHTWLARELLSFEEREERRRRRIANSSSAAARNICSECRGYFYAR